METCGNKYYVMNKVLLELLKRFMNQNKSMSKYLEVLWLKYIKSTNRTTCNKKDEKAREMQLDLTLIFDV